MIANDLYKNGKESMIILYFYIRNNNIAMSSKFQKFIVFNLTFFAYAGLHCLREGWSYSKKEMET
jgi:hypothetical protein